MNLLVVDDSEGFATSTAKYFRRKKWDVKVASNGRQAIEELDSNVYQAVILDRKMPDIWGDEVLKWMSERAEHQFTCTIMCTAHGDVEGATTALKLGAWQYIQKPVQDLGLLAALLEPGVALKQCNQARSELLLAENLRAFFTKLSLTCLGSRAAKLHMVFVGTDGRALDLLGSEAKLVRDHPFVDQVFRTRSHVFSEEREKTRALGPIRSDSQSLLAVPVRGEGGHVVGVLDMESADENAFGLVWHEVLRYVADLIAIFLVNEVKAEQASSAMLYREFRHRIATHAQVAAMQARELMDEELPSTSRRRIQIIHESAETIDAIVRELRDAGVAPHLHKHDGVDLGATLLGALEETKAGKLRDSDLEVEFAGFAAIPEVPLTADESWLKYSFKCLLDNAWEAIVERRKQDVSWREGDLGVVEASVSVDGEYVRVTIADNGIGFEEQDRELIFKALYSTKTRLADGNRGSDGADRVTQMLSMFTSMVNYDTETAAKLENKTHFAVEIHDSEPISTMTIRHRELDTPITMNARLVERKENRGIGLYTVRRVLKQHGGDIEARSLGIFRGANFTISLPCQQQR